MSLLFDLAKHVIEVRIMQFEELQVVKHRKGGTYRILRVPDHRVLEYNHEPFYEYETIDTGEVVIRCKSEMEDGRFVLDDTDTKKILHLHLCYDYFDDIKAGRKDKEYRLAEKWKSKLDNTNYTHIRLYRGYDKVALDTVIDVHYMGYALETITHRHFKNIPTEVCAINVSNRCVEPR